MGHSTIIVTVTIEKTPIRIDILTMNRTLLHLDAFGVES